MHPPEGKVTVTNSGNGDAQGMAVAISDSKNFTVSSTALSITGTSREEITVTPKTGLKAGDYSAKVTISGGNLPVSNSKEFTVSFTVEENKQPSSDITLKEVVFNGEISNDGSVTNGTMNDTANTVEVLLDTDEEDLNAIMIAAYYEDGMLVGCQITPETPINGENRLRIKDFAVPAGANELKAFIWNSARTMKPLVDTVVTAQIN